MPNSKMVTYTNITNKSNARENKISKITIHHYAGIRTTKSGTDYLAETPRDVSANYVIGNEGGVGLNVPEDRRAWTSSSPWNDHRAVTIEVSNSTMGPNWEISDKAMTTLIKLVADIAKRNGLGKLYYDGTKEANITLHEMFANTNCPGPYIKKNLNMIIAGANDINGYGNEKPKPKPTDNKATSYQRPAGTYKESNRFTNTSKDFIYMRQYIPNVNGVDNGHLQPGEYVDYQDVYWGNGFVWVGNGVTWIPTAELDANGKVEGKPWGTYTAINKPVTKPAPKKEKIIIDKVVNSWSVHKNGQVPTNGNVVAYIKPSLFGGLTYDIQARPYKDVVTIKTQDYGLVNLYLGGVPKNWYKIV